jgi:ElaB/YqjD/DUF883 family membrane-anchored ribosome-binding protein
MDKAHDVKTDLTELGSLAVEAAKERAKEMKDGAVDLYEQGLAQAKTVQNQTEGFIKREPLKAMLIAGAAGLAVGWFLFRRDSR